MRSTTVRITASITGPFSRVVSQPPLRSPLLSLVRTSELLVHVGDGDGHGDGIPLSAPEESVALIVTTYVLFCALSPMSDGIVEVQRPAGLQLAGQLADGE